MFRAANIVMLLMFLFSMAVQYNDPDPIRWIALYGYSAIITGMAIAKRYTVFAPIGLVVYVAIAAYQTPGWDLDTVMLLREPKMSNHNVELAREAFGLLICAVWMAVLTRPWWKQRNSNLVD